MPLHFDSVTAWSAGLNVPWCSTSMTYDFMVTAWDATWFSVGLVKSNKELDVKSYWLTMSEVFPNRGSYKTSLFDIHMAGHCLFHSLLSAALALSAGVQCKRRHLLVETPQHILLQCNRSAGGRVKDSMSSQSYLDFDLMDS